MSRNRERDETRGVKSCNEEINQNRFLSQLEIDLENSENCVEANTGQRNAM